MRVFSVFYFFLYFSNLYLVPSKIEKELNEKLNKDIMLYFENHEILRYYHCQKKKNHEEECAHKSIFCDCVSCTIREKILSSKDINSFLDLDFKTKKEFFESLVKRDYESFVAFKNTNQLFFKNYDTEKLMLVKNLTLSLRGDHVYLSMNNSQSELQFYLENKEKGSLYIAYLRGNNGEGRILMQIFIKLCLFLRCKYNIQSVGLIDAAQVNNFRAFSYYLKYGFEYYCEDLDLKKLYLQKISSIKYSEEKTILTSNGYLDSWNLTEEELNFFNNKIFETIFLSK